MLDNITLIIPMSGIGSRFIKAGYSEPKPLIKVDKKPIIEHVVNLFPNINDIIFICNKSHLDKTNMSEILKQIKPNSRILEVPDNLNKGPVFAVCQILDHIDDDKEIIFSYCDYGTVWDFENFMTKKENYDGLIPCYTGFHPHMLGSDNYAFCKIENGLVSQIKEKEPFTENKMNEFASNGTYYFKSGKIVKKYFKELVEMNINVKNEYYISLVYNLLIRDGLKVGIFEIEKMLQWGTPYDLEIYMGWSDYFDKIKVGLPKAICPKNTTLILPMAGKGSRFLEVGYEIPKPFIPINNSVMVIEAIKCLPETEKKIFICMEEHEKKFSFNKLLKEYYKNCEIVTIKSVTEGQACTCEIGIKESELDLNSPILISACDNGMYYDKKRLQSMIDDETIDIIVWSFRNNQSSKISPNSYAWLDVDCNNNIKYVSCKKFIYDDPLKTHAIIGTMFFRKAKYFLDGFYRNYIENVKTNGEFYVDDVLNQNIKEGLTVKVFEVENFICWGTPNDYLTYNYWYGHFTKN
jgi:NDP-sugar pyrophosphorylase family protein